MPCHLWWGVGGGGGVLVRTSIPGGGARGRLCLTLHCHHQNDFHIKMGSDESHFNVSLTIKCGLSRKTRVHKSPFLKREESQKWGFRPTLSPYHGDSDLHCLLTMGIQTYIVSLPWGFRPTLSPYHGDSDLHCLLTMGIQTYIVSLPWGFRPTLSPYHGDSDLHRLLTMGIQTYIASLPWGFRPTLSPYHGDSDLHHLLTTLTPYR